jgi:hypothetical protein
MSDDALITLPRLEAAADAISVNLVDLERDSTHQLLESAALRGETARAWADARGALAQLFDGYARLTDLLDRARGQRGVQLEALVLGPSIVLSSDDAPMGGRSLLAGAQSTECCTPTELLGRMTDAFDRAQLVIARIGRVWDELTARVGAERARLAAAVATAGALGIDAPTQLAGIERALSSFAEQLLADPLSVDGRELGRISEDLDTSVRDLERVERLRAEIDDEMARAYALAEEVCEVQVRVRDAREHARSRIAGALVPPAPGTDVDLRAELAPVAARIDAGDWVGAEAGLAHWNTRAHATRERALVALRAATESIEARDELRGRLEALRAKADGVGAQEDAALAGLYRQARDELYTAPTDLRVAAELLGRYQTAVAAWRLPREVPR